MILLNDSAPASWLLPFIVSSSMSLPNPEVNIDAVVDQDLKTINGVLYPASSLTAASKALFENDDGPYETISRPKVEGRIDELQSEVRALKSCLNTTTITGRLPPEILSRIFSELISAAPTTGHISQRLSWVRVTYVCRRWRAVALTFPALWSSITVAHEVWTELMLRRSKEAPLSIELDTLSTRYRSQAFKAILSKIFRHGTRLHSVKLCVTEADTLSDFPVAVPRLQHLILSSNAGYCSRDIQLPAHFLADTAPELEHLEVDGFSLPWKELPSAPKLTFLKLAQRPSGGKLPPAAFVESIGRMSLLQDINIANLLPSGLAAPLSDPFNFSAIQSLTLADDLPSVLNFLQSCAPFHPKTIDLVTSGASPTAEAAAAFFASVAALWKDTAADKYKVQLGMQALHLKGLEVVSNQNLTFEAHYQPYDPKAKSRPDLRISLPISRAMVPLVVSSFAESFNASTIRWLTIALGNTSYLGGLWNDVFSRWETLETLQFMGGRTVFAFVYAMKEEWTKSIFKKASRSSRSISRPFFPALTTIKCREVDFDMAEHGLGVDAVSLARLLRRWPRAHPLRELHLDSCRNFTSVDYNHIEEKVPVLTVKWDGDEDIDEEDDEDDEDDEDEDDLYGYDDYGFGYDYDYDYDYL